MKLTQDELALARTMRMDLTDPVVRRSYETAALASRAGIELRTSERGQVATITIDHGLEARLSEDIFTPAVEEITLARFPDDEDDVEPEDVEDPCATERELRRGQQRLGIDPNSPKARGARIAALTVQTGDPALAIRLARTSPAELAEADDDEFVASANPTSIIATLRRRIAR